MERLTKNITETFNRIKMKTNMIIPIKEVKTYEELEDWYQRCAEKLAEYEELEESGMLIKLPCKIGSKVYCIGHECSEGMKYNCEINGFMEGYLCRTCGTYPCTLHKCIEELTLKEIDISKDNIIMDFENFKEAEYSDLGETVFLTYEEAEEKLKEMENE